MEPSRLDAAGAKPSHTDFGNDTPAGHIAKGSSGEVRSMYYAAEDIQYVTGNVAQQRREKVIKVSKGIATLTSRFRQ